MTTRENIKPALLGAVVGVAGVWIVGFSYMGWTMHSTAEQMASARVQTAVVNALTPICVAKFRQQDDAVAKLVEFKKVKSWDRPSLIEKGGWATMSGNSQVRSAVINACAEKLGSPS